MGERTLESLQTVVQLLQKATSNSDNLRTREDVTLRGILVKTPIGCAIMQRVSQRTVQVQSRVYFPCRVANMANCDK